MAGSRPVSGRESFRILFRADLSHAFHSGRGVLFLVFFGLFWAWIFTKLGSGWALVMTKPEAGFIAAWLFDDEMVRLFHERSPSLVAYLIVALWATPVFATLVGCDQTASDLSSRHLRFLIPRTGRASIYLGRFAGAAFLLAAMQLVATAVAVVIAAAVDPNPTGEVVMFGLRVGLTLAIYSIAFVAMFAPLTAAIASPAGAALAGLGTYAVIVIAIASVKLRAPWVSKLLFVTPGGFKGYLTDPDLAPLLGAFAAMAGLTAVYLAAGWKVFRERDA